MTGDSWENAAVEAPFEETTLAISELKPSQLYLHAGKLSTVVDRVDFAGPEVGPLPVYEFDGDLYLTDGHTRAFTAFLAGCSELRVTYDAALPEKYDVEVYEACIEWCAEAGVTNVSDFAGRVLDPDAFEEKWVARCQAVSE